MRFLTWLLFISVLTQSFNVPYARAHDDHGGPATGVLADETVKSLQEHIEKTLARSRRLGVAVPTDAEEKAGDLLVDAVFADVVEELRDQHPTMGQEVAAQFKKVLHGLNPVAIGRWLLDMARRQGPAVAIIYGVSEVAEQVGVLLSAKYPFLLFLVPLDVTHASDVIVLGLAFGIPQAIRLARLWHRFGGILKGPGAYYDHLLAQRRSLPIDWSEVIDVATVKAELGEGIEDVQLAIISENVIERILPRALRVAIAPHKLAQRESVPTFSLHDLEKLAKANGIELKTFRPFKGNPQVYATLLIREISLNHEASVAFTTEVRVRHEKSSLGGVARDDNAWAHATVIDAEDLLKVGSVEELKNKAREADESPDLLAQRAVWYLRDLRETLYQRTKIKKSEAGPDVDLVTARKSLRSLGKLIEKDKGLARLATSRFPQPSDGDWQTLHDELHAAGELIERARQALPKEQLPDPRCEELLLGA